MYCSGIAVSDLGERWIGSVTAIVRDSFVSVSVCEIVSVIDERRCVNLSVMMSDDGAIVSAALSADGVITSAMMVICAAAFGV